MTKLHIILYIRVSNMFSMHDICARNVPIYEWTNFVKFSILNRRMLILWWICFYTLPSNSNKIPSQNQSTMPYVCNFHLLCCQPHYFIIMIDHMILSTYTTSCHSLKQKKSYYFPMHTSSFVRSLSQQLLSPMHSFQIEESFTYTPTFY
jgi:hypothetical protein